MSALHDTEGRIEAFLRTHFRISPDHDGFARDVDIFERGYVDSVGVIELLQFLEAEFEVEVPEDSLLSDDFSTVEGIARIVQRLRGERDAARRGRESMGPRGECALLAPSDA